MYSVVLMMALSGGTEAPACFGHGGCCGGYGSGYACCGGGGHGLFGGHGCCGGGGGLFGGHHGCCGGGGGLFGGHHGCCGGGGLFGGHHNRCCGGGGLFGGHHNRCCGCSGGGYACTGGYACSGGYACTGVAAGTGCAGCGGVMGAPGAPGMVVPPSTMPTPEQIKPAPKKAEGPAPATILVSLPANAKLTVDGNPTTSTSAVRTLITPVLELGSSYVYTLRAELNGQAVTQQVEVRGGETSQAEFNFNGQGVASR